MECNGIINAGSLSPTTRTRAHSWDKNGIKRTKVHHHHSCDREFKIAIVGPKGVGKSAISVRYLTKRYIGDYDNKETTCSKIVTVDGKPTKITILDTNSSSNKEEFTVWADGIMLVFSVTDIKSFQEIQEMLKDMIRTCKDIPLLILVGNKSDLGHLRQVSIISAREFADAFQCPYVETSASDSFFTIENAFNILFREVLHKRQSKRNRSKAAYKLLNLKQTLMNLTDFRSRTNTM